MTGLWSKKISKKLPCDSHVSTLFQFCFHDFDLLCEMIIYNMKN